MESIVFGRERGASGEHRTKKRDALATLSFGFEGERTLRIGEELLTFYGTGGEACHDPVLEDHDQNDQWDCHQHGSCHDRAPGLFIRRRTAKLGDNYRDGLHLIGDGKGQREQEFVPGGNESQ